MRLFCELHAISLSCNISIKLNQEMCLHMCEWASALLCSLSACWSECVCVCVCVCMCVCVCVCTYVYVRECLGPLLVQKEA